MLKEFDETLKISGFKTRNEWLRAAIREFLEGVERKKVLQKLRKLEVKGLEEKDTEEMVGKWLSEKSELKKEDINELDHIIKRTLNNRIKDED